MDILLLLTNHLLESADMDEQDAVDAVTENHGTVIKKNDRQPGKAILERFRDFSGTYDVEPIDWGLPAGKEIW